MVDAAFNVLCEGGTILCPTSVGYTVFALDGEEGMAKIDQVKGREKKPYGTCGNEATFSRLFNGLNPPLLKNDFCKDTAISFVSAKCVAPDILEQLRVSRAVGPSDEVALVSYFCLCSSHFCRNALLLSVYFLLLYMSYSVHILASIYSRLHFVVD